MWTNVLIMKRSSQVDNLLQEMNSISNEPGAVYYVATQGEGFFADPLSISNAIKKGVPYSFFEKLQSIGLFDQEAWANFLDISTKSLQRYKTAGKRFKAIQSEKIIEVAEVTSLGLKVFGDNDRLKTWLDTESIALGGSKPVELLSNSYGKDMVISELTNIHEGIFV